MPTKTKRTPARASRAVATKRTRASENGARSGRRVTGNLRSGKATIPTASAHFAKRLPIPVDEKHVAAVKSFEAGLGLERRQNYRKAREVFEKLVATGPADVADRARVHLRACTERLQVKGPEPRTAVDYHVLGVAELNVRDLDRAVEHLSKARKLQPKREEIRYALAAAHALRGDREAALEHLEAAISLRPQNRFQARQDADFKPLAGDPRFLNLVSHGGNGNGGYWPRL